MTVDTSFDPGVPAILGDADQLTQVLLNLGTNAVDAMPDGGTLRFETEPCSESDSVLVKVIDTGLGMTAEQAARIFEPFFTTKAEGQGTGLGMSVSLGIVKSHGGSVAVDSALGRGTTMRVRLPRSFVPGAGSVGNLVRRNVMTTLRMLGCVVALMAAVLGTTGPAAAVDGVLYEVTEAVKVTGKGGMFKSSTATLTGDLAPGTGLCPTWLTQQLNMSTCMIVVRANGKADDTTGIGPAYGDFDIVVQDWNTADAPEIVVMKGTLTGTIDLSPAFTKQQPVGSISGRFNAIGLANGIMAGAKTAGTFTGTFRLPFRHAGQAVLPPGRRHDRPGAAPGAVARPGDGAPGGCVRGRAVSGSAAPCPKHAGRRSRARRPSTPNASTRSAGWRRASRIT